MSPAKSRKPRLALVGPDSLQGKEILSVLTVKKFPVASFELFDPGVEEEYSKLGQFRGEAKVVHALSPAALEGLDLVFLAADERTNKTYGGLAAKKNYIAIDLGGGFNADPKVPLVVAGVNDSRLRASRPHLVANPHPAAIVLSHIVAALRDGFGLARAVAVVLEPVSPSTFSPAPPSRRRTAFRRWRTGLRPRSAGSSDPAAFPYPCQSSSPPFSIPIRS